MVKFYHVCIKVTYDGEKTNEQRFYFNSKEKADEFLRLAHILQIMVRGETTCLIN